MGIVTALNPVLGYEKSTELANEAYRSGKGLLEVIREEECAYRGADQRPAGPGEAQQSGREQVQVVAVGFSPPGKLFREDSHVYFACLGCAHGSAGTDLLRRGGRPANRSPAQVAPREKPNVVILATGGTIAGAAESGTQSGYTSGAVTIDAMLAAVPGIDKLADGEGRTDRKRWIAGHVVRRPAETREAHQPSSAPNADVDGIVITHGTDTMEESAYFLNLTAKTSQADGDGRLDATFDGRECRWSAESLQRRRGGRRPERGGRGVLVVMNDQIHGAHSLTKTSTTRRWRLSCRPSAGSSAWRPTERMTSTTSRPGRTPSQSEFDISQVTKLPRVDVIFASVDMSPDLIDASAVERGAKGIVIAGVGNGNMNKASLDAAAAAVKKGVVVVRGSARADRSVVGRNVEIEDDELRVHRLGRAESAEGAHAAVAGPAESAAAGRDPEALLHVLMRSRMLRQSRAPACDGLVAVSACGLVADGDLSLARRMRGALGPRRRWSKAMGSTRPRRTAAEPRRRLVEVERVRRPVVHRARLGGGLLYDFATYSQDEDSKQQLDASSVRCRAGLPGDAEGRGSRLAPRLSYSAGICTTPPPSSGGSARPALMVGRARAAGRRLHRTHQGRLLDEQAHGRLSRGGPSSDRPRDDAFLPILADGVKWIGRVPSGKFVYSLGWFKRHAFRERIVQPERQPVRGARGVASVRGHGSWRAASCAGRALRRVG